MRGFMDDDVAKLVEEFEQSRGQLGGGVGQSEKEDKKQLTEEQTKALLQELNHQQREEPRSLYRSCSLLTRVSLQGMDVRGCRELSGFWVSGALPRAQGAARWTERHQDTRDGISCSSTLQPPEHVKLSPELARILQRFQRRAGLGPGGPLHTGEAGAFCSG
eukprot:g33391.t1